MRSILPGEHDREARAAKRVAGLVDYGAGLRRRIARDVTHGIGGECPNEGTGCSGSRSAERS
jgi:hypothetical protein